MTVDDPNASLFFSAEEGLNLDEVPETEVISAPEGGSFTLYKCSEGGRIKVLKAIRESFRGDPLCEEMLRRNMVADFQTYRSVFCPEGGDVPWPLHRAG